MNVLLVGGPADGRRAVVADGMRYYRVARLPKGYACFSREQMSPSTPMVAQTETYLLYPLSERDGTRAYVGLHESLNPDNLLAHLVAGYKHEVQP